MNPNSKLLLDETHRLFGEQKTSFDFAEVDQELDSRLSDSDPLNEKCLTVVDDYITKHFTEIDNSIAKHSTNSDIKSERWITNSELRQSALLSNSEQRQDTQVALIKKMTGDGAVACIILLWCLGLASRLTPSARAARGGAIAHIISSSFELT